MLLQSVTLACFDLRQTSSGLNHHQNVKVASCPEEILETLFEILVSRLSIEYSINAASAFIRCLQNIVRFSINQCPVATFLKKTAVISARDLKIYISKTFFITCIPNDIKIQPDRPRIVAPAVYGILSTTVGCNSTFIATKRQVYSQGVMPQKRWKIMLKSV